MSVHLSAPSHVQALAEIQKGDEGEARLPYFSVPSPAQESHLRPLNLLSLMQGRGETGRAAPAGTGVR